MPRGDKSKYTDKQERKADHIAEGYEHRGVAANEAERRAWATVNKDDGGGKKPGGSGRGKHTGHPAAHAGGDKGGAASAHRTAEQRSASEGRGDAQTQRRKSPSRVIGAPAMDREFAKPPFDTPPQSPPGESPRMNPEPDCGEGS